MNVLSREFLKKLKLESGELVIVDMEAGVEHFGRGVETSVENVLVVVEPPLESMNVAEKIYELAVEMGIKSISAVLNKVPSAEIAYRLESELKKRGIVNIGCIHYDADVFTFSIEGTIPVKSTAAEEIKSVLDHILSESTFSNQ